MPGSISLEPSCIYHICSRGNNREDIFLAEHDRRRFLDLYEQHVALRAETFTYCLLPNHFHLLLRFRDDGSDPGGMPIPPPSRSLSNMLNAYARAFNRDHGRVGALFQRPFRRVLVQTQAQLIHVVMYIHLNPQRHGLVEDFRRWHFSSLPALLATGPTRLARDEVLAWFGGREAFTQAHLAASVPLPDETLRLECDAADTT